MTARDRLERIQKDLMTLSDMLEDGSKQAADLKTKAQYQRSAKALRVALKTTIATAYDIEDVEAINER